MLLGEVMAGSAGQGEGGVSPPKVKKALRRIFVPPAARLGGAGGRGSSERNCKVRRGSPAGGPGELPAGWTRPGTSGGGGADCRDKAFRFGGW